MLHDRRLTEVRHLNEHLRFPGYACVEDWEQEAAQLRRHILVTTGLWPFPEKTPLRIRRFGKIEGDGFTVEKVYFESYPGLLCTGNLYLPVLKKGPLPGVLNPHGHWATGRIEDQVLGSIPARCLTFARQGYAAFAYDMVGYNDSMQVDHQLAGERNHLWGISSMGLQLWNSLRAVDFLCSLPEVDPTRIGCTGASGGGTQTFMLAGIEDRVKVAAPAVDEKANAALKDYLAEFFEVPGKRVSILRGANGREKTVEIVGKTEEQLKRVMDSIP